MYSRASWYGEGRMRSRWNDAETRALEELDRLVYASRLIGAETSLVVWGGGNTSIKTTERDHRSRPVDVLRVKGSGSDLKSIQRKDFPGVRMDDIRALLDREDMDDQDMVSYLARGVRAHDRADHAGRGGDRRAQAGPPCFRWPAGADPASGAAP